MEEDTNQNAALAVVTHKLNAQSERQQQEAIIACVLDELYSRWPTPTGVRHTAARQAIDALADHGWVITREDTSAEAGVPPCSHPN
jgi:hypothetical protein